MTNDRRSLTENEKRRPQVRIFNFIQDNCTAIEFAVYGRMQRHAGLNGICFASTRKLMLELNLGQKAIKKAQQKFLIHGWISSAGKMAVSTPGGKKFIDTFYMDCPKDFTQENVKVYPAQDILRTGYIPDKTESISQPRHYINTAQSSEILLSPVQDILPPRHTKTKEDLEREKFDSENEEKKRRQAGIDYNLYLARTKKMGGKISLHDESLAYITM